MNISHEIEQNDISTEKEVDKFLKTIESKRVVFKKYSKYERIKSSDLCESFYLYKSEFKSTNDTDILTGFEVTVCTNSIIILVNFNKFDQRVKKYFSYMIDKAISDDEIDRGMFVVEGCSEAKKVLMFIKGLLKKSP